MTLVELMVGIAVGLLVIAVATGALMVSRGVSGTVTDASQLQQQASYAFRILGQQIRQAGSMQLNLAANKSPGDPILIEDFVAFSPNTEIYSALPETVPPNTPAVSGKDAPAAGEYRLSLAFQNYEEPSFPGGATVSFFRDCLGAQPSSTIIQSQFVLDTVLGELRCAGSNNVPQSLIRNVADFQVRYLIQNRAAAQSGLPTIQYVSAAGVPPIPAGGATDWSTVFGVEVCLVLYGDEPIDMPAGSDYTGCVDADGNGLFDKVVMTSLAGARRNRLHMAFRSVFQLRSQGLAG
ncbi:MAG: PilW family protein [Burkholderiaceae bacterium]|nr:PilW family protein [Burkholderiaceae bacterium]